MKTEKYTFPIEGLHCASCAARAEKVLSNYPGVMSATVNLLAANASVECNETVTPQQLADAISAAGYTLVIEAGTEDEADEAERQSYNLFKQETIGAIILTLPLFAITMFFPSLPFGAEISALLSTIVLFYFGRGFFTRTYAQLKQGSVTMDTLVALSTTVSYLFSLANLLFPSFWLSYGIEPHLYFEAVGMVVTFILVGRWLELRAKNSTTKAIKELIGLQPQTALLERNGTQKEVPISSVQLDDIIVVRTGEKVAVDGIVIDGTSYIDESMLSGEAMPVAKKQGSSVYSGTINQEGTFRFTATKIGSETLLSQIIALVEQAQNSKAPVQKLVDKIASLFVPTIIAIAILAFVIWNVSDSVNGFSHGILAFVTVLVIACPCALGLATPTAILIGVGAGANRGILIKDAQSLEVAKNIDRVVLDKTGTITEGKPAVIKALWSDEDPQLKDILYSLEKRSTHPIALSVAAYLLGSKTLAIESYENIAGLGITGTYNGTRYFVGSATFAAQHGVHIDTSQLGIGSVVVFGQQDKHIATLVVTDKIKENAVEAISSLQKRGIKVSMLTGDNPQTAAHIAAQVGIETYTAQALPADKAIAIKTMQSNGHTVAMVGDGINDSAALAQSDLSIAMGTGSDIAMNVAGITIVSSDLRKVEEAITISKLTVRAIRQNLFWAFIYNLVAIPIAAGALYPLFGVMLSPVIASAAMALSSVSVVVNSLRIRKRLRNLRYR
ncbi:MAG: heavy metal translocating P-type ATPase [Phocaeicola sp.]